MKIRAFVIIREDGKFLLIRESNPKWKNAWYLPGGNLENGEQLLQAAVRETKEEAGYDVAINGICFVKYCKRPVAERGIHFFLTGRIVAGMQKIEPDEHSIESGWFTLEEISAMETRNDLLITLNRYDPAIPLIPTDQVEL